MKIKKKRSNERRILKVRQRARLIDGNRFYSNEHNFVSVIIFYENIWVGFSRLINAIFHARLAKARIVDERWNVFFSLSQTFEESRINGEINIHMYIKQIVSITTNSSHCFWYIIATLFWVITPKHTHTHINRYDVHRAWIVSRRANEKKCSNLFAIKSLNSESMLSNDPFKYNDDLNFLLWMTFT